MSLFEGFDVPNTEEISNYTGEKLLLELEKNKNSKRFYESLTKKQTDLPIFYYHVELKKGIRLK